MSFPSSRYRALCTAAWDRPALSLVATSGGSDYAFQATLTPAFPGCDGFVTTERQHYEARGWTGAYHFRPG